MNTTAAPVDLRVEIEDANAHRFRVTLTLPAPAAEQVLTLPVWIPGSYLVRDFARHLSSISARQGRQARAVRQDGTSRWVVACSGRQPLVLQYSVYAFDPSVRGAFLDAGRGFFNGSSLFLCAEGHADAPHRLRLGRLPAGWQVATSMRAESPRRWRADGYADLIDHPVALGRFWRGAFTAGGVPHDLVVDGAWPGFDGPRLQADVARLCEAQIRFWHPRRGSRPPFDRYLFLLHVSEEGQGGLEHRFSTALSAPRRDLPRSGQREAGDAYVGLLGLFSHEYFHAWNVTRLKPAEHARLDLSREQPTELLWFFEGFTSYYDDLMLLRAGLVDRARYLRLLARTVNTVRTSPGRHKHPVAAASFEAWTKFYRPDENTANTTVSYYAKGALIALLCDLALRDNGSSLDEAMRTLWRRSGGGPVTAATILQTLAEAAGSGFAETLHGWVHGTAELPLQAALAHAGIAWRDEAMPLPALLGLRLGEGPVTGVQVRQVLRGSAAEAAGLSAGDELLAANGWRIRRLDDARQWLLPGQALDLLTVRDQRLHTRRVKLPKAAAAPGVLLDDDAQAGAAARALRRAWLGG